MSSVTSQTPSMHGMRCIRRTAPSTTRAAPTPWRWKQPSVCGVDRLPSASCTPVWSEMATPRPTKPLFTLSRMAPGQKSWRRSALTMRINGWGPLSSSWRKGRSSGVAMVGWRRTKPSACSTTTASPSQPMPLLTSRACGPGYGRPSSTARARTTSHNTIAARTESTRGVSTNELSPLTKNPRVMPITWSTPLPLTCARPWFPCTSEWATPTYWSASRRGRHRTATSVFIQWTGVAARRRCLWATASCTVPLPRQSAASTREPPISPESWTYLPSSQTRWPRPLSRVVTLSGLRSPNKRAKAAQRSPGSGKQTYVNANGLMSRHRKGQHTRLEDLTESMTLTVCQLLVIMGVTLHDHFFPWL